MNWPHLMQIVGGISFTNNIMQKENGVIFLPWHPRYSVHVKEIDEQHQMLFDMVNRIYNAIEKKDECILDILREMARYLHIHFTTEEKYLENHPAIAQHKLEHLQFTEKTLEFINRYETGDQKLCIEICDFLSQWLMHHTLETDQLFFNSLS